jgi:branched-chain amino acid aminotransferase
MEFAIIDGKLVPAAKAVVPISDRGLRFGDGAFETIAIHSGIPYQYALHLKRLKSGLSAIGIPCPKEIERLGLTLLRKNKVKEGFLRIMVTRGSGSEGYLPSKKILPRVMMETLPRKIAPASARVCLSARPKISPLALPTETKLMQGLGSVLARMEAEKQGCLDALMLSAEGHIAETSSANIFWVKGEKLYTPSLAAGCVAGTTRAAVMRLFPASEGLYPLKALQTADGIFLTNTNWQILPVTAVKPWKKKYPADHALIIQLQNLFAEDIARHVAQGKKRLG